MVPCCGTLILPYLYLGDESDASDPIKLKSHNIYYVLNVTADLPGDGENDSIRYKRIPARDSFDQNLVQYFEESFQFIEEARQAGRAVLIHCHAGISRSPTIVVAYLMYSQKMNFTNAYKFVESKRPIIAPNFSFVGQLFEYGKTQIIPTPSSPKTTTTVILTPTATTTTSPLPITSIPTSKSTCSSSPSSSSSSLPIISVSSSTSSNFPKSSLSFDNKILISSCTTTTTLTSNVTSTIPLILPLPSSKQPVPPRPTLSLVTLKSASADGKLPLLLSPISLVTNTLSTTTITTSISAPTTPTSPMLLPPPMPTTPLLTTTLPTTPTNRSYLKLSDTLNKPSTISLQPPPPPQVNSPSHPLKESSHQQVKPTDILPTSCEALSDIPYNSLGPVRGCRGRKSCNNDFILLRPIKMTKNTRVK